MSIFQFLTCNKSKYGGKVFMISGLTKEQKDTVICFDESSNIIDVYTHNTSLKHRLKMYSEQYPDYCVRTDEDEHGGVRYEIEKGRFSFRFTAPYSEDRKQKLSKYAKEHGMKGKWKGGETSE